MKEPWPTTRRVPRTMDEAFPDKAREAEWLEPPEKELCETDYVVLILAVFFALLVLYFYSRSN